MLCPNCQHEIEDSLCQCPQCGAALPAVGPAHVALCPETAVQHRLQEVYDHRKTAVLNDYEIGSFDMFEENGGMRMINFNNTALYGGLFWYEQKVQGSKLFLVFLILFVIFAVIGTLFQLSNFIVLIPLVIIHIYVSLFGDYDFYKSVMLQDDSVTPDSKA